MGQHEETKRRLVLRVTYETQLHTNLEFEEVDEDLVEQALDYECKLVGWEKLEGQGEAE